MLLDCCYSGSFMAGAKGDDQVHVRDELAGHGRAVLTATNRTEYAWEGASVESLTPAPSRFTGAVIEGLATGAADVNCDGRITVTDLYDYVYEAVRRTGSKQSPRMWTDLEYQVVIARARIVPDRMEPRDDGAEDQREPYIVTSLGKQSRRPRGTRQRERGNDSIIPRAYALESLLFGALDTFKIDTAGGCPTCDGCGTVPGRPKRICEECGGEGRVRVRRTLTIRVPVGVESGTRIRLAGEGEVGPGGGPPGDLYVEVGQLLHDRYTRDGDDLHCVETIPRELAEKGGFLELETLDGFKRLKVPRGTPEGRTFRIAGLGLPNLDTKIRGNLLVALRLVD